MIKVKDELSGSLPVKKGKIIKPSADSEEKAFKHGFEHAKKILVKAGARNIKMATKSGAHPGGTAKIGEVVDANLQTKFENLYVCDTSVYPGMCGIPPVWTLVALGKYLAKRLT
jgi:choline dehydrogenase-like flavoprotein